MLLRFAVDSVDAGRRSTRVKDAPLFVEIDFEVVGGPLEVEVLDSRGCMLADFGRYLFEEGLLEHIVEGDVANSFADV